MSVALLDGDIVAFRAASTGATEVDWDGDGNSTSYVSTDEAISTAFRIAEEWRKGARCDQAILCLSDRSIPKSSFRYLYHPLYKRHRTSSKPEAYEDVIKALRDEYRTIIIPRLEADDVLGIWATNGKLANPVAVSTDKDMLTIPGRVFNPMKMKKPVKIGKHQAMLQWMKQTLIGDTVDGYKGCPGIGEAKATKLLEEGDTSSLESAWGIVLDAFKSKKKTLEDAVAEARCARILQTEDYNEATGEIRIWHPTNPKWVSLTSLSTSVE